jgi:aminopeptidase N
MAIEHRFHARCGCRFAAPRAFALPSSSRQYERDRPFLVRHLFADLTLDFPKKSVIGKAVLTLERVDAEATHARLDAVGFDLRGVRLDSGRGYTKIDPGYDGETLLVPIPSDAQRVDVEISYRATPRRGMYFLAPDEHVRDRPVQVWTQCQDEDARHFLPCIDKPHLKQTSELLLRVPPEMTALSNGRLVEEKHGGDHGVFHWKMDKVHSTYLLTVVAGRFEELSGGTVDDVPLTYLVPEGRGDDARRTFAETPGMVAHFGALTGVRFPWNKYAQIVVSDFIFGGMENTSATTLYEHTLLDAKAAIDLTSDDLIAHELAHQWFGDFVTCRDWSHGWLNEGFATYFEHVDRERRLGTDEYFFGIRGDQDSYLGEARGRYQRPVVCQDYEAPIDLFDRHLYEKGGLVLHMLRQELGDEVFWRGVGTYLTRHAYGLVETRDLLRALEDVSGRSLEGFFDQWLYKPGHADLAIGVSFEAGVLSVHVKQSQKKGESALLSLPIEVEIVLADGTVKRESWRLTEAETTFSRAIQGGQRPRHVVVDPRHRLVGEVVVDAPADMLRHQLKQGASARARWRAADALAKKTDVATLEALAEALADESAFWGLRAVCAEILGATKLDDAFALLKPHAKTAHPKVRRAVAGALGKFRLAEAAALLTPLALNDASYAVEAEAARALGATRQPVAFDTLVTLLDRSSWADIVRAGAIDGLAALRDDRAVPHLLARTRYGVPTRARRASIRALAKLSTDRRTREHLEDLLEDSDPHLRIDVAIALGDLGDAKSRGPLQRALGRDLDGRVRRRLQEVLRDLTGSSREEQKRLAEEVEGLKKELGELKARLGKLEAPRATTTPPTKPATTWAKPSSVSLGAKPKNGPKKAKLGTKKA